VTCMLCATEAGVVSSLHIGDGMFRDELDGSVAGLANKQDADGCGRASKDCNRRPTYRKIRRGQTGNARGERTAASHTDRAGSDGAATDAVSGSRPSKDPSVLLQPTILRSFDIPCLVSGL
jgi:hypothetical protein